MGYDTDEPYATAGVAWRPVGVARTVLANRSWWDAAADSYQAEHGTFLRDAGFVWCPEGLAEDAARLLGDVAGRRVLEIGCGAAQCSRWLAAHGADVVGIDLSSGQLGHARSIDRRLGTRTPVLQAEAGTLPFASASFDLACSAYGAMPFVADTDAVQGEIARVLHPGGRWVFSVSHPVRWALDDDAGADGLVIRHSYFDRTPYVEQDDRGCPTYVEHHRTLGDWVRGVIGAGMQIDDLVEPEWPDSLRETWGGWSPLRGRLIPGTAIFCCSKPGIPA